jgi:hypothetical protein
MQKLAVITSCALIAGASAAERQITDDAVTLLGITAGSDQTLNDVAARLGPAKQWHTGDAGESESKLCYRFGEGPEAIIVVFASSSEMSSPKGQVNAIRVYGPQNPFAAKRRCAPTSAASSDLRTPNGIRLATTHSDISSILWPRPMSKHSSVHYESCRKRYLEGSHSHFKYWAGRKDCGFEDQRRPYENDCLSVEVQFKGGSASFFELSRGQSIC